MAHPREQHKGNPLDTLLSVSPSLGKSGNAYMDSRTFHFLAFSWIVNRLILFFFSIFAKNIKKKTKTLLTQGKQRDDEKFQLL